MIDELSEEEIQKPRSPRELREYVKNVEAAWKAADKNERDCGRLKKGLYRKFIIEIRPLGWVADLLYPETYKIKPNLGFEGYDATVLGETGTVYEHIEIGFPHDGQEVHQDAMHLVETGNGRVDGCKPANVFDALLPFVEATCKKKARKDYSGCTIVICISAFQPMAGFENEYEKQLKKMIGCLSGIKFKAKRVFLFLLPNRIVQLA